MDLKDIKNRLRAYDDIVSDEGGHQAMIIHELVEISEEVFVLGDQVKFEWGEGEDGYVQYFLPRVLLDRYIELMSAKGLKS